MSLCSMLARLTPPPRRQISCEVFVGTPGRTKKPHFLLPGMGGRFFIELFIVLFTPIGLKHFVCNFRNISKYHSKYGYLLTEDTDKTVIFFVI